MLPRRLILAVLPGPTMIASVPLAASRTKPAEVAAATVGVVTLVKVTLPPLIPEVAISAVFTRSFFKRVTSESFQVGVSGGVDIILGVGFCDECRVNYGLGDSLAFSI